MLLKDCKILQQYRHRDETETELALLMSEFDQSQQFAQVRLASAKSRDTAKIRFHNVFEGPVRALWMDFDGHEVAYSILTPGEDRMYMTYHNHCWIVRDLHTGRRLNIDRCQAIFADKDRTQKVRISAPPLLSWQDRHHTGFPEAFRRSTKMLLFCHHSLSKQTHPDPSVMSTHSGKENRNHDVCQVCQHGGKRTHAESLTSTGRVQTAACLQLPTTPSSLGSLPLHILKDIVQLSAPTDIWQDACCQGACPDILPALAP